MPRQSLQMGSGSLNAPGIAFTPKEITDIFRRHLFLIISLTVLGAICGSGLWFVLRKIAPKYTATTYIEVLHPGQSDPTIIGTPLASKDIAFDFRSSKAALIKQQSMLQELIRRDAVRDTEWFKQFHNDVLKTIDNLKDNLGVSPDRNSNYIIISMTCGSPKEAALIVNQMVDLFVKSQQTNSEADVGGKLRELSQQENDLRDKLRTITSSLADIRRSTGITQLENNNEDRGVGNTITQKFGELEIEKLKLEADIEQVRANATNFEGRGASDEIVQRDADADPVLINLTQQISSLQTELARKLTNLGENHREVQQLREVLRRTIAERDARSGSKSQQIRNSDVVTAKDQLAVLTNRLAKLEELRAQTENEQRELDNTKATYNQLVADRDEAKTKLFSVQEQISKYNLIKQDSETSKVKPVGLAPEPLEISSPKLVIFMPGGTFLGFMLGIGLAFLVEILNDLLRTPNDVMKFVNIPLLGMITHKDFDEGTSNVDMCKVTKLAPLSMVSECYRQFRTNLRLSSDLDSQRVIFVASGKAGEGRTTIAVNTAVTFAAEDKRVLLIDANFRRPSSYKVFPNLNGHSAGMERNGKGLSDYLVGSADTESILRPTDCQGVDVIDSGQLPANPAELLGGKRMTELIKYAKEHYDRVIIDGPPMLISDAKALASQADGTVLVFNTAITRRGTAKRIVRELREINANILGSVLIGVRMLKGGYFREMLESYQDYQKEEAVQKA